MKLTIRTPAKLNLGLEVLGRRPDGFHDLATIFQTINIYDKLHYSAAPTFTYESDPRIPSDADLARPILVRAATEQHWTGRLKLQKEIPVSAGLGGGSSDAALALRLAHSGSQGSSAIPDAASIGADVPFLLQGGTASASGIGDVLSSLPTPDLWFVVHTPDFYVQDKTRTMFSGLEPEDFGDGSRIAATIKEFSSGLKSLPETFPNAFERQMLDNTLVKRAWQSFRAIAGRVALSGAGPSIYSWHRSQDEAERAARNLARQSSLRTILCRAIPAHVDEDELRLMHRRLAGESAG